MRITKVTPVDKLSDQQATVEASFGDFGEVEEQWYREDAQALEDAMDAAGLQYREYTLMRKAIGAETGLVVALILWGGAKLFDVLKAWLPAREGRKVRIKFKDGTEIEAHSVEELEKLHDRFLAEDPDNVE
ncbi:hypothetical protein AAG601_06635 [Citromicrobium bathyomarinum]